jgi:WhiB family transcriptional regulator, redox-sensing transcriptional regulator
MARLREAGAFCIHCPRLVRLAHDSDRAAPGKKTGPELREGVAGVDWRHRAACLNEDPELFFPVGNCGPALIQIVHAKTVCARCCVSGDCLRWALESGQDTGVCGGSSEQERRDLRTATTRELWHSPRILR